MTDPGLKRYLNIVRQLLWAGLIASGVVGLASLMVLDVKRSIVEINSGNAKFAACMHQQPLDRPHWQAARKCIERVPDSRRGRRLIRDYGL